MRSDTARRSDSDSVTVAALVIGVALGGFFDGILLHQILQWHHLLSLVPGETFRDLRMQIYADGLFHLAMYGIAMAGLVLLWRARRHLDRPAAGGRIAGGALLGFGVWNVADIGLFHWILGLHRIRVDVADPLAYDLSWLMVFGIGAGLAGLALLRRGGPGGPGRRASAALVALLLAAVPAASIPTSNDGTLIVFGPDTGPARAIDAIVAAGGDIVLIDPAGGFAVARMAVGGSAIPLYRAGALLVTRSPALAGCLAFVRRT